MVGNQGSDDLFAEEADVVSAVRSWFEHDAAGRKGALKTLLPLIRWPRLPVEAPEGTAARPITPDSSNTSHSTVGLPRLSRISRPTYSSRLDSSRSSCFRKERRKSVMPNL